MKVHSLHAAFAYTLLLVSGCAAFTTPTTKTTATKTTTSSSTLFPSPYQSKHSSSNLAAASTTLSPSGSNNNNGDQKIGMFSFKTKYGFLNPFAIYYGVTSILLGIPWFVALNICQLFYKLTGSKFDKLRRLPIFLSHVWGVVLLRLTRSYPVIENKEILDQFFKE